jgi:hypothetical protein
MSALRAVVVVGFSAFLVAISVPAMFVNPPWPYTGITVATNAPMWTHLTIDVAHGSPAYRAGLRSGEQIGCLSVRDNYRLFSTYAPNLLYTPDPISLCALQNGTWRNVTFAPRRMPPPGMMYGTPFVAALRTLTFLVFLFVGCALVLARPSPMTWLLFGFCAGNVPSAAEQGMMLGLSPSLYAATQLVAYVMPFSAAPLLALFTLAVPDDRVPSGWRRSAFRLVAAAGALTVAFTIWSLMVPAIFMPPLTSWIDEAFTALTVLLVIARLANMERLERARFGWAAFAIMFGVVCNVVRNEVLNNDISIAGALLSVVMPLALMYAILRRHVIDVRFVISRGVVYGVITTLVVGIIGLVDWATSAYMSEVRVALAVDAAVTILLGIALHRSYGLIEHFVDFLLFRRKHEAEAYLLRLSRTLLRADREETVDHALAHDPYEKLELTMAALFRAEGRRYVLASAAGWESSEAVDFERDHDLVRFLATERNHVEIRDLRKHVAAEFVEAGALAAVAIPIFRGDDLFAFGVYGLHRDGTRLDPDEIEILERLCDTAAQAYMRIENVRYHSLLQSPLPA